MSDDDQPQASSSQAAPGPFISESLGLDPVEIESRCYEFVELFRGGQITFDEAIAEIAEALHPTGDFAAIGTYTQMLIEIERDDAAAGERGARSYGEGKGKGERAGSRARSEREGEGSGDRSFWSGRPE